MNINDKIFIVTDMADPTTLSEYTVSKIMKDSVQCNGNPEMVFYSAFCWPIRVKDQVLEIVRERQDMKRALDDQFKKVYELRNKIGRGEL